MCAADDVNYVAHCVILSSNGESSIVRVVYLNRADASGRLDDRIIFQTARGSGNDPTVINVFHG